MYPRRSRRGNVLVTTTMSAMLLFGCAALALEFAYHGVIRKQLQSAVDSAAHAAVLELDGTAAGLLSARSEAERMASGHQVAGYTIALAEEEIVFGDWDKLARTFTETADPTLIDAVRIQRSETVSGFGLAALAFGAQPLTARAKATVVKGKGRATTGDVGGPGVENGHFDFDSVAASKCCPGATTCNATTRHTHEYDDTYDTTLVDLLSPLGGHLSAKGCISTSGAVSACTGTATRVVPDSQTFRILVVNADLSPGAILRVNGVDHPVTEWDDQLVSSLTTYSFGAVAGATQLTELKVVFNLDAIASCELIPTNTGDVKKNKPGMNGVWRNGALTVQLVKTTATTTAGKSAGDHDVVIHTTNGLLYEGTFFWHWDGPSYHESTWQSSHEQLICATPLFVD